MPSRDPSLRLREALARPVDPASLVCFRIGFGLLATLASVRFVAYGWVRELYLEPTFHFGWLPFVEVPRASVLYGLFLAQAVSGLGIASGRWARVWLLVWLVSFGWVELLDKALYLNHYVLFTLLGVTLFFSPVARARMRGPAIPAWVVWLFRLEVGLVYFWAGVAKLNADWLLRAEPLLSWLQAKADLPLIGPLLALDASAWLMSWGGAAFDLGVPFLLLWRRTRPVGLCLVLVFHSAVGLLFSIGMFPLLMLVAVTWFLEPSWPRRWLKSGVPTPDTADTPRLSRGGTLIGCGAALLLLLVPGRSVLLGSDVSWTERGHRFAWRVLLNEKTGLVDFRIVENGTGRIWKVTPTEHLSQVQREQMNTQPDLIRDYAHHLAAEHAQRGRDVAVYADAWASLNGRSAQRLIRPDVDLVQSWSALEEADWIVPLLR